MHTCRQTGRQAHKHMIDISDRFVFIESPLFSHSRDVTICLTAFKPWCQILLAWCPRPVVWHHTASWPPLISECGVCFCVPLVINYACNEQYDLWLCTLSTFGCIIGRLVFLCLYVFHSMWNLISESTRRGPFSVPHFSFSSALYQFLLWRFATTHVVG